MPLINFIQKIQQKPRYIRLQILWLSVFVCAIFIFTIWLTSFKQSLPAMTEETKIIKESAQPLAEIKKEIPSLKEALQASIEAFSEEDLAEELEKVNNQLESNGQGGNLDQFEEESETINPAKLPLGP